ncbi:MAG: LacI family DNA-binding transcriptional regulator [Lentisphaeria bacterium]|nr:LacI family DNA-binding transcriptional regulator [Lentisphaeria bacterium]
MKKYNNMAEFAAELNLARSTVSYILNDKWKERNISPETVKRVKDYARKVNFIPNFFGRAIKGKVTSDAAILLPVRAYLHHREAFFHLLGILDEIGLKYLILPVSAKPDAEQVLEQVKAFNVRRALLIAYPILKKNNVPVWKNIIAATPETAWLLYDCPDDDQCPDLIELPNAGFVGFDRREARQMVFRCVRDHGYRTLRHYGFSNAEFRDSGLGTREITVGKGKSADIFDTGRRIAEELIRTTEKKDLPQAVFINDDQLAIGVIACLQSRNFRVPEDFAFISWDGLEISRLFRKNLTTLKVPHEKMLARTLDFFTKEGPLPRLRLAAEIREGETMSFYRSSR